MQRLHAKLLCVHCDNAGIHNPMYINNIHALFSYDYREPPQIIFVEVLDTK